VVVAVVIGIIWWGVTQQEGGPGQSIHIAALIPLTGNGALDGELISRGLQLAQAQLNVSTNSPVRITIEDTKGNSKEAVSIYQKLKLTDPPQAVITWGSGVGLALTPLVNEDQVIQMGVATSAPDYSTPNDYTFRIFPLAADEASFIISHLQKTLGTDRLGIATINNDYGTGLEGQIKKDLTASGITVVGEEVLEPAGTDFRTQISQLKAGNPDTVLLLSYSVEGATFLRQTEQLGLDVPVIASSAIFGNDIIDAAGAGSEGVLISNASIAFNSPNNQDFQQFLQTYEETFGETLNPQDIMALRGFDSLNILVEALRECDANTVCAKDKLLRLRSYKGINGTVTFDKNGDLVNPDFGLMAVIDGQYESAN